MQLGYAPLAWTAPCKVGTQDVYPKVLSAQDSYPKFLIPHHPLSQMKPLATKKQCGKVAASKHQEIPVSAAFARNREGSDGRP